MGAKDILMSAAESWPCFSILTAIARTKAGRRFLNRLGDPYSVYDTFQEGWTAARRCKPAGHEHHDDIILHLALSSTLRSSDYAVLYWLTKIAKNTLTVFDYGGSAGNLYYSYLPYLDKFSAIDWTVYDLPLIMEEGQKLAAQRKASNLKFASSAKDLPEDSIVLVSGAFHYWEKSVQEFLDQFLTAPRHIILNRSPVHEDRGAFVTIQSTESYAVPCIVRNAKELVDAFVAAGYILVDRWPALELRLRLPLFPAFSVHRYSGFYFRKQ